MIAGISPQFTVERAINSVPEGLLVAAFAWVLLRFVGRQNSSTRFAVWLFALAAIIAIPFIPRGSAGNTVAHVAHAEITVASSWGIAIFAIWLTIALFGAVHLLYGIRRLSHIRKNCVPVIVSEQSEPIQRVLNEFCAERNATVCTSSEVAVPTAFGFIRPLIVIPGWALRDLSPQELRSVLLHERAHLQRRDAWTNLVQKIARTVFFFHPAVWWVEKRLSIEREMACDDAVLEQTADPHEYARCLVSLAEKSVVRRGLAMAQAAISRAHETSLRLAQILDSKAPKATRVFKPALGIIGVLTAGALFVVPEAPRLISFRSSDVIAQSESLSALPELTPQVQANMIVPVTMRTSEEAKPKAVKAKKEVLRRRVPARQEKQ
ncbi:MAG TPA: M56 family metallopeptidase, partial [Terriglobales bacterium]